MTGVFCLEGDWYGDHNRSASVRPLLELLGQGATRKFDFVHRDVATREEFAHHIDRWRRTKRYGLLYLAFHGAPGHVLLGHRHRKRDAISLNDIAAMTGTGLSGRVVHFGSCSTLRIDRRRVAGFLRRTGMIAATGFAAELDWFRSSVFELLVLSTLLQRRITPRNVRDLENVLKKDAPSLRRELAFRMVIRDP